ncbi:MAG: ribulose-phosphate 3-epimerase [Bacteroides sp.]|nr:MAG: ribulose-phosphate 3-epimerase [Bacteroides sp.]
MNLSIAPSIIAAEISNIDNIIKKINESQADVIHIDIMDGHFVPNIAIGFDIVNFLLKYSIKPLEVHLMVTNPNDYVDKLEKLKIKNMIVHYEAIINDFSILEKIKKTNMKVGIALNPNTAISVLLKNNIIQYIDIVLIMSVYPGFSGQKFITKTSYDKLYELNKIKKKYNFKIEIDGGINMTNIDYLIQYNPDILVIGKSIFHKYDQIISKINYFKNIM